MYCLMAPSWSPLLEKSHRTESSGFNKAQRGMVSDMSKQECSPVQMIPIVGEDINEAIRVLLAFGKTRRKQGSYIKRSQNIR